jgi:hypothetical protein
VHERDLDRQGHDPGAGRRAAVVQHYLESVRDGFIVGGARPDDKLVIDRVQLKNAAGEVTTTFPRRRAALRRDITTRPA